MHNYEVLTIKKKILKVKIRLTFQAHYFVVEFQALIK